MRYAIIAAAMMIFTFTPVTYASNAPDLPDNVGNQIDDLVGSGGEVTAFVATVKLKLNQVPGFDANLWDTKGFEIEEAVKACVYVWYEVRSKQGVDEGDVDGCFNDLKNGLFGLNGEQAIVGGFQARYEALCNELNSATTDAQRLAAANRLLARMCSAIELMRTRVAELKFRFCQR